MWVLSVVLELLMVIFFCLLFFFRQKTAYEMRISDWSSDVCSSDLIQCVVASAAIKIVDADVTRDRVVEVGAEYVFDALEIIVLKLGLPTLTGLEVNVDATFGVGIGHSIDAVAAVDKIVALYAEPDIVTRSEERLAGNEWVSHGKYRR